MRLAVSAEAGSLSSATILKPHGIDFKLEPSRANLDDLNDAWVDYGDEMTNAQSEVSKAVDLINSLKETIDEEVERMRDDWDTARHKFWKESDAGERTVERIDTLEDILMDVEDFNTEVSSVFSEPAFAHPARQGSCHARAIRRDRQGRSRRCHRRSRRVRPLRRDFFLGVWNCRSSR